MLFNLEVRIEIPSIPSFKIHAILDTGATTCCIDENSIPKAAMEENPYIVHFNGITSKTTANKKLKGGKMTIGDNTFRINEAGRRYPNDNRVQLHTGHAKRSKDRR